MAGVPWSFLQRAAEMSRIKIGFRAIMGYLAEGFAALGGTLDYARTLKMIPLLATTSFLPALTKFSTALPSPASPSLPPRPCVDFQTPVAVNTTNQKWKNLRADSNADAVEFLLDLETWSSPNLTQRTWKIYKYNKLSRLAHGFVYRELERRRISCRLQHTALGLVKGKIPPLGLLEVLEKK